jgi:hypothetical protein
MTWIQTIPLSEANESLLRALESQRSLYPKEYAAPVSEAMMRRLASSHRTASFRMPYFIRSRPLGY